MSVMLYERNITTMTKDVDINSNLRPSAVLDYFQDMAGCHATMLNVGYDTTMKLNLIWVVLYQQFEVVSRIPGYDEEILLRTWPKSRSKIEFEREYEIRAKNGNLLIKGVSNWATIDMTTRRLSRGEKIVFDGEYYPETNYPEKQKRKLGLSCDEALITYEYKVLHSDLDRNKHMNNARYLDIIYNINVHKDNKKFKRVQMSFINEAHEDDTIKVLYYQNEKNEDCYIGSIGDKPCFEVVMEMED